MTSTERVQDRTTGRKGDLLNARTAATAIVQWDDQPNPTWAEWRDIA